MNYKIIALLAAMLLGCSASAQQNKGSCPLRKPGYPSSSEITLDSKIDGEELSGIAVTLNSSSNSSYDKEDKATGEMLRKILDCSVHVKIKYTLSEPVYDRFTETYSTEEYDHGSGIALINDLVLTTRHILQRDSFKGKEIKSRQINADGYRVELVKTGKGPFYDFAILKLKECIEERCEKPKPFTGKISEAPGAGDFVALPGYSLGGPKALFTSKIIGVYETMTLPLFTAIEAPVGQGASGSPGFVFENGEHYLIGILQKGRGKIMLLSSTTLLRSFLDTFEAGKYYLRK